MPSNFTLFFSWQSDNQIACNAIRHAIENAISKINDKGIYNIMYDESTLGVPGMPPINRTVENKIKNCDIFVADVTPVASNGGKLLPNSNVMHELGYARAVIGYKRLLAVGMNTTGWQPHQLPFDINHDEIIQFKAATDLDLTERIEAICRSRGGLYRFYDWVRVFKSWRYVAKRNAVDNLVENSVAEKRDILHENTDTWFTRRIGMSFPGIRGVHEFTSQKDIVLHLKALFAGRLSFYTSRGGTVTPMWWFRCGASEGIEEFEHTKGTLFRINADCWDVSKVVVYSSPADYYHEYVYVEINPQKPTELGQIGTVDHEIGDTEEYGLMSYKGKKVKVTRREYDDGYCVRNGKIISGSCELRVRYLTKYNFLICSQESSYNSRAFDLGSKYYMNELLNGSVKFDDFHSFLMKFPKRCF